VPLYGHSLAFYSRLIAEESDRSIEELRRQLSMKNDELHMQQQISLRMEQKYNDLQDLNRSLKDELNSLRTTIGLLDKEKDKLLQNVDEKTEDNVTLKQELSSKVDCFVLAVLILFVCLTDLFVFPIQKR
jgi:hypothetical protein